MATTMLLKWNLSPIEPAWTCLHPEPIDVAIWDLFKQRESFEWHHHSILERSQSPSRSHCSCESSAFLKCNDFVLAHRWTFEENCNCFSWLNWEFQQVFESAKTGTWKWKHCEHQDWIIQVPSFEWRKLHKRSFAIVEISHLQLLLVLFVFRQIGNFPRNLLQF